MFSVHEVFANFDVALRKESVDRNGVGSWLPAMILVALRKESVDRNRAPGIRQVQNGVALRKESVDRNAIVNTVISCITGSLSARRAWIEMPCGS